MNNAFFDELTDKLDRDHHLSSEEWEAMFSCALRNDKEFPVLLEKVRSLASDRAREHFGRKVFIRGLIEFTDYCRNDCYYCGIRKSNVHAQRYRLTEEEMLSCMDLGYELGFRTFVLQGGEDGYYNDERLISVIEAAKDAYPDCALTLSVGERSRESYEKLYKAGADRYLLRHETADEVHYRKLHPKNLSLAHRMNCLRELSEIGYQTGCGFMVGSPGQSAQTLAKDMAFMETLRPHMVGIGPYISHQDTPFAGEKNGSVDMTLFCLGLTRLLLPDVLLPSTTALRTLSESGTNDGILSGANVVMPNLSPPDVRAKYSLYEGKKHSDSESAEGLADLKSCLAQIGYEIVVDRGDSPRQRKKA